MDKTLRASVKQILSPGTWIGDVIGDSGVRKSYGAVRLTRTKFVIRTGDCVKMRPPSQHLSGWEGDLPWVGVVRDLFEEAGAMMFTCVWFYRCVTLVRNLDSYI